MESKITKILAEEIKDSRGNPTLKVIVWVGDLSGSFSVPSGASTGAHEAHELRDEDGKGVKNAIEKVNNIIAPALIGQDVLNQKEIDRIMITLDGTYNKDNLGGNSMIGVSVAVAKVAAKVSGIEVYEHLRTLAEIKPSRRVPHLYMNLINGGKHAKNDLSFQEYLAVSLVENAQEAVDMGIKIQNSLKEIIKEKLGEESLVMGDEGGYAPQINEIREPLKYLTKAIKENNLEGKVKIAIDMAASSFYENGKYEIENFKHIKGIESEEITKDKLLDLYNSLAKEFDLISVEDAFEEEDFESFEKLKEVNDGLIVIGDDLTVTNKMLLQKAIKMGSINGIIIKPNQIGTVTEMLETMRLARENNFELIVAHRSGDTMDDFIADLAFAFGCFGLKAGSPIKPERMVKYQRLIEISKM